MSAAITKSQKITSRTAEPDYTKNIGENLSAVKLNLEGRSESNSPLQRQPEHRPTRKGHQHLMFSIASLHFADSPSSQPSQASETQVGEKQRYP